MTDEELQESMRETVGHCANLTLSLVRLSSEHRKIEEMASGFFITHGAAIYLVSAGHALSKSGWAIETTFTLGSTGQTACIPVGATWTLKKMTLGESGLKSVDIAWAKVDLAAFQEAVRTEARFKGKSFEYTVYQGPLDTPAVGDEFYVYAAPNRVTALVEPGRMYLERNLSYEYGMQLKETRKHDGLYAFAVPSNKGRDYYQRASGAPIIDPAGIIVAIFVGGNSNKNELYGFPMQTLLQFIKVAEDSENN